MRRFSIPEVDGNDSGSPHVKTTWEVSRDDAFTDLVKQEVESEDYVTYYNCDITLLENEILYVRAKRYYDDGTESDWLNTLKIKGIDPDDIHSEVFVNQVEKPNFTVSSELHNDAEDLFTITTSPIVSKHSGHTATLYIIEDDVGNIIYKQIGEDDEKTVLELSKSALGLEKYTSIIIKVSHINTNHLPSRMRESRHMIYHHGFTVNTDLSNISVKTDTVIDITWETIIEYKSFDKIEILTLEEDLLFSIENQTDSFTIPKNTLKEQSKYIIRFYPKTRLENTKVYKDLYLTTAAN
jgi:hypothetical protein